MKFYIMPALEELNKDFLGGLGDYLSSEASFELIKCIVFIIFLILNHVFFWIPYQGSLNNKIWRTKGMLNMIPIEIIIRNP